MDDHQVEVFEVQEMKEVISSNPKKRIFPTR